MKRSRQIEEIFEECLEQVFRGESVEDCVRRYPEHESELRGLLETSLLTRKALDVQPSAEFRERARQELYAAQRDRAAAKQPARRSFGWTWQPRWAMAVAGIALAIVAGTSTVLASVNSMPGQPLYGVKHAAESARVALTPSKAGKAEIYASLADQRVKEIIYLADKGEAARVGGVTNDLNSYLSRIAELSGGIARVSSAAVPQYGAEGSGAVPTVTAIAPTTAAPRATAAPTTGNTSEWSPAIGQSAPPPVTVSLPPPYEAVPPATVTVIVPGASAQDKSLAIPPPTVIVSSAPTSSAILRARILFQAEQNIAQLRAALVNAPPDARAALLQAIAVSQSGYEKALQALDNLQ